MDYIIWCCYCVTAIRFWTVYGTEKISSNRFLSRFVTSKAFRFHRNLCQVSYLIAFIAPPPEHPLTFLLFFIQPYGFKAPCRELETKPKGLGIQHSRHTRLHCARSKLITIPLTYPSILSRSTNDLSFAISGVSSNRLRSSVRLVVAGRDHVRNADGLSTILFG